MITNRKYFLGTVIGVFFSLSLHAQQEYAQQKNENFYYYKGEKIYLQPKTDKLLLEFVSNTNRKKTTQTTFL